MCVCVRVREIKRERERWKQRQAELLTSCEKQFGFPRKAAESAEGA